MAIEIAIEPPLQDDVRVLVEELNTTLLELTPPEHCYHLTVEQMAGEDTTVFVARDDGLAVGCGALKRGQIRQISNIAQCDTDVTQKAAPFDPFNRRIFEKHAEVIIAQTEIIAQRYAPR